ncbi:uncharacterized protein A4U43_C10F13440 [Asparagus officinalis]|uniref:Uncharacterized protein n=1 Tax=Asparagus officinalis TaxID=4686 RepID=A0A5P1E2T6_ASPOF|nr:uncharacterized protein A4U43_C10F13440 [Asparagus officinalis]
MKPLMSLMSQVKFISLMVHLFFFSFLCSSLLKLLIFNNIINAEFSCILQHWIKFLLIIVSKNDQKILKNCGGGQLESSTPSMCVDFTMLWRLILEPFILVNSSCCFSCTFFLDASSLKGGALRRTR